MINEKQKIFVYEYWKKYLWKSGEKRETDATTSLEICTGSHVEDKRI